MTILSRLLQRYREVCYEIISTTTSFWHCCFQNVDVIWIALHFVCRPPNQRQRRIQNHEKDLRQKFYKKQLATEN